MYHPATQIKHRSALNFGKTRIQSRRGRVCPGWRILVLVRWSLTRPAWSDRHRNGGDGVQIWVKYSKKYGATGSCGFEGRLELGRTQMYVVARNRRNSGRDGHQTTAKRSKP
jgi:hypothetical protein